MGEGAAGSSGTASFLLHVSAHVCLILAVLGRLLRVGTLLTVVLNEVHQAVHHSLYRHQAFLQLLPGGRRSIWIKN